MQIDDETLMALADGELDPARAQDVRRAVDADPELQARLNRFVETRRLLGQLRAEPASGTDDPLAAMIRKAATAPPRLATEPARPAPPPANLNRRPWLAAAASAAVVALGLGWWQFVGGHDPAIPQAEVAALNELPSGTVRGMDDGTQLSMIASFRADQGQLCREYEMAGRGQVRMVLACRESQGWRQRFAALTDSAQGSFQPASDESSIDAALQAIGAGDPLTPDDEAAALGNATP